MVGRESDRSEGREQLSRHLTPVGTVSVMPLIDSPAQKGSVIAINIFGFGVGHTRSFSAGNVFPCMPSQHI